MATLLLETTDNKQIAVDSVVIRESAVLNGIETTNTDEAVPVAVSSNALNKIKTFCDFFKDAPAHVRAKNFTDHVKLPKDSEPMKWIESLDPAEFFELHEAANFFNMSRLIDAMVDCLLNHAQSADVAAIRQTFRQR